MTRCSFAFLSRADAGTSCGDHAHPCVEIVHVGESSGVLRQNRRVFRYEPRSVFVYRPGTTHRVENLASGTHACLGVLGRSVGALPEGVWAPAAATDRLFRECRMAIGRGGPYQQRRLDGLADLIICELRECPPLLQLTPTNPVDRVRALLDAANGPPVGTAALARMVGLSEGHLRHRFAAAVGMPPLAYQNHKRLERARHLIETTSDTVAQIADTCGFADPFYFARLFARRFGVPPSGWRKRGKRPGTRA